MDDHMLYRISQEIKQCFMVAQYELGGSDDGDITNTISYMAAKILISTYNRLVKLYYLPEYYKNYLLGSVAKEYKNYKQYQY